MMRNLKHWLWITVALLCVSCGMPKTHYYTMEHPHATQGPGTTTLPVKIAVQRFRAERILMDDRIVYREGPNEVNFYEYHRWSSAPVDLTTDYFAHRLKDAGTYQRILAYNEVAGSDYTLRGRLHHFEEVDRGKEVFASVALELELMDTKTRALVWRGEAESTRPLASRDMAGVVRGIFDCLDEVASRLLGSMQQEIEKRRQ